MTERNGKGKGTGRTAAEWVTFGIACFVLLAVVGLIVAQMSRTESPPVPVASRSAPVDERAGRFYVPVEVVNNGDRTAADVQVSAELTIRGETTAGDQTIDFLAGDEVEELTFVFDDDPRAGELVISVTGFATP